jgi:hypothetical protein
MASAISVNVGTGFKIIKINLASVEAAYSAAMAGAIPHSLNGQDIEQATVNYLQNLVTRTVDGMGLTSKNSE